MAISVKEVVVETLVDVLIREVAPIKHTTNNFLHWELVGQDHGKSLISFTFLLHLYSFALCGLSKKKKKTKQSRDCRSCVLIAIHAFTASHKRFLSMIQHTCLSLSLINFYSFLTFQTKTIINLISFIATITVHLGCKIDDFNN